MIGRFLTGRTNHLDVASACLTSAAKSEIIDSPSRVNPIALNAHTDSAITVVELNRYAVGVGERVGVGPRLVSCESDRLPGSGCFD